LILRWTNPVFAGIGLGGLVFIVPYILWAGLNSTAFIWFLVALVGFSGFTIGAIVVSPTPTIEHGVLTYPSRWLVALNRRRPTTKSFPLRDVVDITVDVRIDKEDIGTTLVTVFKQGLSLLFPGDIRLWLNQGDFQGSGMIILEQIARLHGISYIEETMRRLLGPNRPRFRVFNAQRLDGAILVFDEAIPTCGSRSWKSEGKTKRIAPEDVLWIEPVQTQYAGACYLATRKDGIRFLIPASEIEALRLQENAAWTAKFSMEKESMKRGRYTNTSALR